VINALSKRTKAVAMDWIDWLALAVGGWFLVAVTLALALARMVASAMGAAFTEEPAA
jgi:hypothetical protein